MLSERSLKAARIVSLIASITIALGSGTNYVYSAYAPQLADKLRLSNTESNLIGTMGNIGMYLAGIPAGILVDSRGPRLSVLLGAAGLLAGYYPIHVAYEKGEGSISVAMLCFFAFITGVGSCCSFNAALKAAALNWPKNRGAATAFPLAAFGLSAFFFSTLSSWLFPGDTSSFLLVLAVATSATIFVSFFFLRVIHLPRSVGYTALPDSGSGSNVLHRTKSGDSIPRVQEIEPGTASSSSPRPVVDNRDPATLDETSSILSKSSDEEDLEAASTKHRKGSSVDGVHVDIRGMALVKEIDFWLLWFMLGLMTGVGLMTINNIGHSVKALWMAFDPTTTPEYIQKRQALHVSILSILSFTGRIISGTTSDHIKKNHGLQRIWLLVAAASLFILAQTIALNVENPYYLWMVSSCTGLAYGLLFGVFPTIVSEVFGIHGLSQNWGCMTVAAVISGQTFNFFFGRIFDSHTTTDPLTGLRECHLGLACFKDAYYITLFSSFVALALALYTINRNIRIAKRGGKARQGLEV
ncbi:MFS general substrate transporter [Ascobolus immersus RN42]|uniref:MFS general substrate transporter n=1 Tax=Ascobolus immersus RN42 TaxID=1160509 RepID=A0A3N4IKC0_ASCIM|nr:MFS general substrate transporter [Ascobolus immersus RN42]